MNILKTDAEFLDRKFRLASISTFFRKKSFSQICHCWLLLPTNPGQALGTSCPFTSGLSAFLPRLNFLLCSAFFPFHFHGPLAAALLNAGIALY